MLNIFDDAQGLLRVGGDDPAPTGDVTLGVDCADRLPGVPGESCGRQQAPDGDCEDGTREATGRIRHVARSSQLPYQLRISKSAEIQDVVEASGYARSCKLFRRVSYWASGT